MKSHIHPLLRCSAAAAFALTGVAHAGLTLYSESGSYNVSDNNSGVSLSGLGMNVARGATGTGTLYFKYTVTNPASNYTTESYYAGMSFYDLGNEHLGIGNGWDPWAYSAFSGGLPGGNLDLNNPDPPTPGGHTVKLVESTDVTTFFFKINFNSGANDNVTVWLNPNQTVGESSQSSALKTTFSANADFNDLRLREGGNNGSGWTFSNIAIAGSFADLSTDTSIKTPETQVFTSDVTMGSKSIFEWNLDGDARSTRGAGGYDAVNIAGNLTGSGAAFKVLLHDDAFTNTFWDTNQAWADIFKANADGSGSAFNIAGLFSSITGDGIVWNAGNSRGEVASQGYFTLNGTSLNWTAVPEPTSALVGGLLGAGLLRRRRKD